MIEWLILRLICLKISHEAENSGRSPTLHVVITIVLWFGLEFVGILVGYMLGLKWVSYVAGLLLAAFGAYISYVIASHSDYRPRENYQRSSYPPLDLSLSPNVQQVRHAQVTIERERCGSYPPDIKEFFLNGKNVGGVEDGSSITVPTGSRSNVLLARDTNGALTPPFEFSVEKDRHSKVVFRDGMFVGAKTIGRMS